MIVHAYDFGTRRVNARARAPEHLAGLDAFLAGVRSDMPTASPDFVIDVEEGEPPALPPTAAILQSGPVWSEPEVVFAIDGGDRLVALPGKALARMQPRLGRAQITVSPQALDAVGGVVGIHAVDTALEATNQLLLHGAALSLPDRSGAVLIHAESGTGKTTTTLNLAFSGWGLYSDDAAVADRSSGAPLLWGLPRSLKIHRNTAQLSSRFASLVTPDWDRNGEQPVGQDKLAASGIRLEGAVPLPLRACIHLVRNDDTVRAPTCVEPMPRTEAAYALCADNIRGSHAGVPRFHMRRFEEVAALVRDVPTLRCRIGAEFEQLSSRLLGAVSM